MPSAGQLLQSERVKQQRTVIDIAEATRINARYIEALERDDVEQLPGVFFYKAFIRQYAKALELNEAETERVLRASVSVNEPDPVPLFQPALRECGNRRAGALDTTDRCCCRFARRCDCSRCRIVFGLAEVSARGRSATGRSCPNEPDNSTQSRPCSLLLSRPQEPAASSPAPENSQPANASAGTPATVTPDAGTPPPSGTSPVSTPANSRTAAARVERDLGRTGCNRAYLGSTIEQRKNGVYRNFGPEYTPSVSSCR